jgi:hypothetical protein
VRERAFETLDAIEDDEPTLVIRRPLVASPKNLGDAVLAMFTTREATSATLRTREDDHVLELRRGEQVIASHAIDDDRAVAMAVRFATALGLDLVAPARGAADSSGNVATMSVSDGTHSAEVLTSIGATARGFHVDWRVLTVDGHESMAVLAHSLRRCTSCGSWASAHEIVCRDDGGHLEMVHDDARPGGTVGAWLVGRLLGEGGMGTVFAAHHALIGRSAAIKVLRRSVGTSGSMLERFLAEARAASRLRHPSIVAIDDFGVLPDGRPYLVMEHLRGESLHQRMDRELAPEAGLRIVRAVASALVAAHGQGVVHHDLKPSNIMMMEGSTDAEPRVKLVDFGAASVRHESGFTTTGGTLYGTPHYMCPERICGQVGDERSDLYSLGIVLYEILAGRQPFEHLSSSEVFAAHLDAEPPPLERPVPEVVGRVLSRALEKDPARRYRNAREMIEHLDRAIDAYSQTRMS